MEYLISSNYQLSSKMYDFLSQSFFTVIFNITAAFFLGLIGILNYKRLGNLKMFVPYAILSVAQTLLTIIIVAYNFLNLESTFFIEYFINIFTAYELFIFSIFFYNLTEAKNIKKAITVTSSLIFLWFLYLWILKNEMNKISDVVTVIESLFFIILSLNYYYGLFKNPPSIKLARNSVFWTVTGIFLLFSLLFPLFLFKDEIFIMLPDIYLNFYAVNHIGYTVLFFCLIKGYICQMNPIK